MWGVNSEQASEQEVQTLKCCLIPTYLKCYEPKRTKRALGTKEQPKKEREKENSLISRDLFVIIGRSFANQPTCARRQSCRRSVANWHSNPLSLSLLLLLLLIAIKKGPNQKCHLQTAEAVIEPTSWLDDTSQCTRRELQLSFLCYPKQKSQSIRSFVIPVHAH